MISALQQALEAIAEANGELVLLGEGWHGRRVATGWQDVSGPCWVAPDRGQGRAPRVIHPVSCDDLAALEHRGLVCYPRPGLALLTDAGRQLYAAGDLP